MELILTAPAVGGLIEASPKRVVTEEVASSTEQTGIRTVFYWLLLGVALVTTALLTLGMRRTLEIWAFSAVAMPAVFVGERLWYKFVRKES